MGKLRLETEEDNFGGREKKRGWKRKSTDDKYREVEDLFGEKETPLPAKVLHIGSRMPKEVVRPKSASNNQSKENEPAPAPENSSAPVSDAEEPLPVKSEEEKIARLEKRIRSEEFNDDERRYIDRIIKDYDKDVYEAKKNIEDGGGVVGDKWIDVFRTSHIEKCKTWGLKRQLAPEKAELLGNYLELKLPVGIPKEKASNNPEKKENMDKLPIPGIENDLRKIPDQKHEIIEFSPEQMKELDDFCDVVKKEIDERFLSGRLNERTFLWEVKMAFRVVFKEDYIAEDIFPADYEDTAMEYIIKKVEDKLKI